ncbi:MAG: M23 family metallopeptidase [Holosporaceae bacterium]|nr:M23 family metallopeptidase [Holosporaceae bacterium]
MRFSFLDIRVRTVVGAAVFLVGYFPVFVDFFSYHSRGSSGVVAAEGTAEPVTSIADCGFVSANVSDALAVFSLKNLKELPAGGVLRKSTEDLAYSFGCCAVIGTGGDPFAWASLNSVHNFFDLLGFNSGNCVAVAFATKSIISDVVDTAIGGKIADVVSGKNARAVAVNKVAASASVTKNLPKRNFFIKKMESGEFVGMHLAKGEISANFYQDARSIGVPACVVDSVIKNMASKINFRHSLKSGDKFEIMYSQKGEMLYAKIKTKAGETSVYKFAQASARPDSPKHSVSMPEQAAYYLANGEKSIADGRSERGVFGPPLNVLHVSDGFGHRRHPITGVRHYHSGVDFSAPLGTPVHAICAGVVTRCRDYYGYGRCIDIAHVSGYASRYAHLSKYAVRHGEHVKKGQIIGYVGSSGISTGPHLHLELAKNNVAINPLGIKMIPDEKKRVVNVAKFNRMKKKLAPHFPKKIE